MVKVIGPCFSLSAQGNLGNAINYCTRNDVFLARKKSTPNLTLSTELLFIHQSMRWAVWTWQIASPNIKPLWDTWAATYRTDWSGFNSFTSYYVSDLINGIVPPLTP